MAERVDDVVLILLGHVVKQREQDISILSLFTLGQAGWTCFFVLALFALAGSIIFKIFGITLPAFKIAGGLLMLRVLMPM